MGFGFAVLRLAPDAFWAMTPRELAAAMEAVWGPAASPLDRATFADLRARFPDARGLNLFVKMAVAIIRGCRSTHSSTSYFLRS